MRSHASNRITTLPMRRASPGFICRSRESLLRLFKKPMVATRSAMGVPNCPVSASCTVSLPATILAAAGGRSSLCAGEAPLSASSVFVIPHPESANIMRGTAHLSATNLDDE
ncbi:hypothetical protein ACR9YC_02375 [Parasphingorhabdus sp. DH2-15]|uniref:hypothetical protein n=1 Tax=Parasphingorhabdus sp. DH2-15 TaxID=3444112 RepID=UPI003F6826DC